MPNRSRAGRSALRQGQRRKTLWLGGPDETVVTTVAPGAADLQTVLNSTALAFRPFTVVRVVGQIFVTSDQVVASEVYHGAFGCAVVSVQASLIGTGAIPTPITEQASDLWFGYQLVAGGFSPGGDATGSGSNDGFVYNFDFRAMRKVQDGDTIVGVFENGSTVAGIDYLARYRTLIKLH